MDIDALATANAHAWAENADAVVATHPPVGAFRAACATTRVGTNVIAAKMARYLVDGHVDSTHAVMASRSGAEAADADCYGRAPWGPRRRAIEEAFGAFRSAMYGTLDLPGALGDSLYGPFRVVYEPDDTQRPYIRAAPQLGCGVRAFGCTAGARTECRRGHVGRSE